MIQFIFETQKYNKPYFLTYYGTSLFSLYLLGFLVFPQWRGSAPWNPETETHSDYDRPPSSEESATDEPHLTWRETLKISAGFCPIWFIANYAFNVSLEYTSLSSNTILSTSSCFFALLLGSFWGIENFTLVKIIAIGICIGGVAVISISDASNLIPGKNPFVGNLLALISALMYGAYTVYLRVQIKHEKHVSMPMFFAFVGMINIMTLWPGLLLVHYIAVERFQWPSGETMGYITLNAFLGTCVSDLLWSAVVLFTTPLVATMGLSLTIPLAMTAELIFKSKSFSWLYLGGSGMVLLGFFLVNIDTAEKEKWLFGKMKEKFFGIKETNGDGGNPQHGVLLDYAQINSNESQAEELQTS